MGRAEKLDQVRRVRHFPRTHYRIGETNPPHGEPAVLKRRQHYQGTGGSRAEIKIADVSAVAGLMDAAGGIAQSVTSESDAGFERNTTVSGMAAHEKYDNHSKHGDLSVIVAKRFVVDVSGDSVDMSALEQYAGAIDYSRLAAMKDVGLQQAQ